MTILFDPQQRSRLQRALDREQGGHLPLNNRYIELARICAATPEQLHAIAKTLMAFKHRYEDLLSGLVFHPNMSEQTLLLLCAKRRCISELGHRRGPQSLLERIALKYRYSEAITTLALSYYSRPDYPTEAFAIFLHTYATDAMLRYNIIRHFDMPLDKWKVVLEVFEATNEERLYGTYPL